MGYRGSFYANIYGGWTPVERVYDSSQPTNDHRIVQKYFMIISSYMTSHRIVLKYFMTIPS